MKQWLKPILLILGFLQVEGLVYGASLTKQDRMERLRQVNSLYEVYLGRRGKVRELKNHLRSSDRTIKSTLLGDTSYERVFKCRIKDFLGTGKSNYLKPCSLPKEDAVSPDRPLKDVLESQITSSSHKNICGSISIESCFSNWLIDRIAPAASTHWKSNIAPNLDGATYSEILEKMSS